MYDLRNLHVLLMGFFDLGMSEDQRTVPSSTPQSNSTKNSLGKLLRARLVS